MKNISERTTGFYDGLVSKLKRTRLKSMKQVRFWVADGARTHDPRHHKPIL